MERQLASLTGLVKKALHTGVASSPLPEHISLAPPPAVVAAAAAASGNTNSREPTTNSNRNSSSNDFLQVPTSSSYKTPGKWDSNSPDGSLARFGSLCEGSFAVSGLLCGWSGFFRSYVGLCCCWISRSCGCLWASFRESLLRVYQSVFLVIPPRVVWTWGISHNVCVAYVSSKCLLPLIFLFCVCVYIL